MPAARSTRRAARWRRARWPTATEREAPAPVATYRDLGSFQLLLSLQDEQALRLFCDSILGPIENGEGHYGGELMRSLEAFIECNGQWEKAARRLYCHRHTLRYRIRKVEELTGRDLSSARDRIEFWLASAAASWSHEGRVLGAGGTIAPAIVRDLAESDEFEGLVLLDLEGPRACGGGRARSGRPPRPRSTPPTPRRSCSRSRAAACSSTRRPTG